MRTILLIIICHLLIVAYAGCSSNTITEDAVNERQIALTEHQISILSAFESAVSSNEFKLGVIRTITNETKSAFLAQNISFQICVDPEGKNSNNPMFFSEEVFVKDLETVEALAKSAEGLLVADARERLLKGANSSTQSSNGQIEPTDKEINKVLTRTLTNAKNKAEDRVLWAIRVSEEIDKARENSVR